MNHMRKSSICALDSPMSTKSVPTSQLEPSKTNRLLKGLHEEDILTALTNLLYPRDCKTLNLSAFDIKPFESYQSVSRIKAIYSVLVEKSMTQFSSAMIVKFLPPTIDQQRLYARELSFYRYVEPQLRHMLVRTMHSPVPRAFLVRGECEEPRHRNPSMPMHQGPPEPGCDVDGTSPALVMQDLSQEGFKHVNSSKEMDYNLCASVLRALATFHAASAVLDRCDPKLKRGSYLKTAFPFLVPERGMFAEAERLFDQGMKIIGELGPHMDPKILLPGRDVPKVVNFMHRNLHTLLIDILKPHKTQLNTLCHTNCLNGNNFLHLQDQKNRSSMCKLIGLSQVRYCRPAVDLALVLFCAGNRDVRTSKVNILLEVYRDQFNKSLEMCKKKHHISIPASTGLLSADQLQESLSQTRLLGVALRAMIVATEVQGSTDGSSEKQMLQEFTRNELYRERLTEAVQNLLEATEPYAGDCWLGSEHKQCPHYPPKSTTVKADGYENVKRGKKCA